MVWKNSVDIGDEERDSDFGRKAPVAWRPKGLRAISAAATALLISGAFILPSHHVTVTNGSVYDLMGTYKDQPVLTVEGERKTTGEIYTSELRVTGAPGATSDSGASAFYAWWSTSSTTAGHGYLSMPSLAVYPHGTSNSTESYSAGENPAIAAAGTYLGYTPQVHAQEQISATSFPDLMLTLAIINKSSSEKLMADPPDLSQPVDRMAVNIYRDRMTGSARVDANGSVHSVGGLRFKLRSAGENWSPYFMIAREDCSAVAAIAAEHPRDVQYIRDRDKNTGEAVLENIRIIPVENVDQAVDAMRLIRDSKDDSLPTCS